jgi:hypothetical protein
VVGYGDGGTLALLAATYGKAQTAKVRAFFSISGTPDFEESLRIDNGVGDRGIVPPFNWAKQNESRLRSALPFTGAIDKPTFYFGVPSDVLLKQQAERMEASAISQKAPFQKFIINLPDRAALLGLAVELIRYKIDKDVVPNVPISIQPAEIIDISRKRKP